MHIRMDLDGSVPSKGNALDHGYVAFQIDGQWCPHPDWYDSLDQVLDYWLQASLALASGELSVEYAFFGSSGSLVVQRENEHFLHVMWFSNSELIDFAIPDLKETVSASGYWKALLTAFDRLPRDLWEKYSLDGQLARLRDAVKGYL